MVGEVQGPKSVVYTAERERELSERMRAKVKPIMTWSSSAWSVTLDYGLWTTDLGRCTLDFGPWTLDYGLMTLDRPNENREF